MHDFQLLQVGGILGLAAPTVLRWHVPFEPARIPRYSRNFITRAMENFDVVIVSTRRDLEGLLNAGFHGRARQLYPHVDPEGWADVRPRRVQALEAEWDLQADDPLILCVARMDPMKRQDLVIGAFARISRRYPRARLAFVGNGSFSAAEAGGLGVSKSRRWLEHLRDTARELRVARRCTFLGWIPDEKLAAAFQRANAVVLASDIEGFGLVALEAWRYKRPVIVSHGCGVSELIQDGLNGKVWPSGEEAALAEALDHVLGSSEEQERLGAAGRLTLENYAAARASRKESAILEEAIDRYEGR